MSQHPAIALLQRETAPREGAVPAAIAGEQVRPGELRLAGDECALRLASGFAAHYRKGAGLVVNRPPGADRREAELFLSGSIHAAIASINGLYPVHASAVAVGGKVHAFTGPSGAGKSTLAARLGALGLPLFCDDTLIVDIAGGAPFVCLPGHKRLKLWPDAIALTGAVGEETIIGAAAKRYARPPGGTVREALVLAELIFLEDGEETRIEPVRGAERLARLHDDHYTTDLYLAASRIDRAGRFAQLAALAGAVRISRFVRPRDPARFAQSALAMAEYLTGPSGQP